MPFRHFLLSSLVCSFVLAAQAPTPDSISWGTAVDQAGQALLAAHSDIDDKRSTLRRDEFLNEQAIALHHHQAISEEEYRSSQYHVDQDRWALAMSLDKEKESTVLMDLAKLHLAFELGTTADIQSLAQTNVQLWEARLACAKKKINAADSEQDFRKYEYDLAVKLAANDADSQSHLAAVTKDYQVAIHAASLAVLDEKAIENALQRARVTLQASAHTTHSLAN